MQRKMDLLERAHALLCNAGRDMSAQDGEVWHRLRAEWIERYGHLLGDQQTKRHNARIAIGNDAITDYERRCADARALD